MWSIMSATDAHPLSSSWIDGIELYGQERTIGEKKDTSCNNNAKNEYC